MTKEKKENVQYMKDTVVFHILRRMETPGMCPLTDSERIQFLKELWVFCRKIKELELKQFTDLELVALLIDKDQPLTAAEWADKCKCELGMSSGKFWLARKELLETKRVRKSKVTGRYEIVTPESPKEGV